MDATEPSRARLTDTHLARKIHMLARRPTGRHHLVIPGDIISERTGDFVGIRTLGIRPLAQNPTGGPGRQQQSTRFRTLSTPARNLNRQPANFLASVSNLTLFDVRRRYSAKRG